MSEHTPEELHEFAAKHAPKLAEKITQLCGAVIARGMTGILEEVCRIQQEADSLRAVNAELLGALEDTLQTLCWLAFGECRNITSRQLMTAQQAEKSARAAITKANALKGDGHEQGT